MAGLPVAELERCVLAMNAEGLASGKSLAAYTSFRIGGPADLFLDPPSEEVLSAALADAARLEVPVTFLGGGTNVLVADRGVRGLVVRLGKAFQWADWTDSGQDRVVVEAGAALRLARLVRSSVEKGLGGLEFAAGIPGSVGGGTLMNAGAFGGEIGNAITGARAVTKSGEIVEIGRSELSFSYRKLALKADVMIISVRFSLLRESVGSLRRRMAAVQEKRRRKQPAGLPNAGSVFKNPNGEFAGRLIEAAGLKGRTFGKASVSPDHGNFIVNLGGACATEVRDLMGVVQEEVWERSGVWLEPELRLIGDWDEVAGKP
ncbi:MAG: UDP-N-acetylmuramate dehydrogenase [Deltaproteobacteria bacterium]